MANTQLNLQYIKVKLLIAIELTLAFASWPDSCLADSCCSQRSSEREPAVRATPVCSFYRQGSVSVLHFVGLRSGPGERQGDVVRDSVQIFHNLGTKPKTTWPKFTLPPRVDFGRLAPKGRRPIKFGHLDFATTVAAIG